MVHLFTIQNNVQLFFKCPDDCWGELNRDSQVIILFSMNNFN